MPDYVCYSAGKSALITEAKKIVPHWVNDAGELIGNHTPLIERVVSGKTQIMSVVRVNDTEKLSQFTKLTVLGQYEDGVFKALSSTAQATYDRMYATLQPVTATLPDGSTGASSVPEVIGAIA